MHVLTLLINIATGLAKAFVSGIITHWSGLPMFSISDHPNNNDLQKDIDYA
jgi:hypothetical protein